MSIEDIKIQRFTPEYMEWFKNDGTFLGIIRNEHEFNHLRFELRKNRLTQDCYFMQRGTKWIIDENTGRMKNGFQKSSPLAIFEWKFIQEANV